MINAISVKKRLALVSSTNILEKIREINELKAEILKLEEIIETKDCLFESVVQNIVDCMQRAGDANERI